MNSGLAQLVANTLITAGVILLVGTGFGLVYQTTRFLHFAHGALFTIGAYFAFALCAKLGWPFSLSAVLAITLTGVAGCALDLLVYRPLRHKGASSLVLLLASLGIYTALVNLVSLVFGTQTEMLRNPSSFVSLSLCGARMTPAQVAIVLLSSVIYGGIVVFMRFTGAGRVLRAMANDPFLSEVIGVRYDKMVSLTFFVGSILAGAGGLLVGFDTDIKPTMGMMPLLVGVVAVVAGGIGNIGGWWFGALILAVIINISEWYLGLQWKDAIVFVILIVFLLVRPQGFFGTPLKKAIV